MSRLVPATKVDAIRALGAEARIIGRSQDEAAAESRRLAVEEGFTEIPPFDHPHDVIAGQGTAGLELIEDRPDLATVLVPLSGAGSPPASPSPSRRRTWRIRVVGVSMDRGAAMHAALAAGHPVEIEEVESLADLGGGLGADNRLTYRLCRDLLDDILLVSEPEIYRAMQALYWHDRIVTEGAAAVGAAALLSGGVDANGPIALLVTGHNVDMETFASSPVSR